MSKARQQSRSRQLSRALKGRESGITSKGVVIFKQPRITTEYLQTIGKLLLLKRRKCGNNRVRNMKKGVQPYYTISAMI